MRNTKSSDLEMHVIKRNGKKEIMNNTTTENHHNQGN